MRLVFFSNVFPNPLVPTKGTFNLSLVRALARDHKVRVVSPVSWIEEVSAAIRRRKLVAHRDNEIEPGLIVDYPRYYYPPKVLRHHYGRCMWWSVGRPLMKRVREFKPDAIVSYWTHPDGEVAVHAARAAGIPCVCMVGGSDVLLLGNRGLRRTSILDVLNAADAVVSVSEDIATQLVASQVSAGKIHVIHRGVDQDVFHPGDKLAARQSLGLSEDLDIFVAVGRLVSVKGFDVLLGACAKLRDRRRPWACYILGGGPLEAELLKLIRTLGLQANVFLKGPQSQARLADWYRAADLAVLSSRSEGIPNVLLEAMSCGTPFVATRVGGVPEITDLRYHLLVEPNDPMVLADALRERLDHPRKATLPLRFMPLSWEASANKVVDVVERALANANRAGDKRAALVSMQ